MTTSFPFDLGQVQVTDEKYYVKGIRLAGRDNNTVSATTFRVTGDADYVVAYGIKGNLVSYTVKISGCVRKAAGTGSGLLWKRG